MSKTTIKQIANDCGVSEQAIRKYCEKHNVAKVAKRWKLDESTICEIYTYYGAEMPRSSAQPKQEAQETQPTNETNESTESEAIHALVNQLSVIQEQLKEKDKQIENLQNQISELIETNKSLSDASKALSATNAVHTFTDKQEEIMIAQPTKEEPKEKKSWFQRLFNK